MTRLKSAAPALLLAALLLLLALLLAGKATGKMPDFEVYWTAAARARAAEPLYRAEDGHYQFKYLPAFAVLAIPAALLPLHAAKHVWFGTSIALLVALIALAVSVLPERLKARWMLVVVAIVGMGKFYAHELVLGQVNLLFAVVVLLALRAMRSRREGVAGLLFSLAIVIKPYAVLFAPWLAGRRRPASIAALCAGLAVTVALPALVYGLRQSAELHVAWWRTVTESTAPNLTNADNVSLAGMFSKWFGAAAIVPPLVMAASLALLGVAAFVFWRRGRVTAPDALEVALLLTLIPLLSPQGWDYVFLIATPAIVLLANYAERLPGAIRVAAAAAVLTIGLSLYDVMGRAAYAEFMRLSLITLCFLVLVVALATVRIRGIA